MQEYAHAGTVLQEEGVGPGAWAKGNDVASYLVRGAKNFSSK